MSPFRPSRERVGPDPHLDLKMVLFAIGAAFAVAGMVTGLDWLVYIAIAILVAGLLFGFRRRRQAQGEPGDIPPQYDDESAPLDGEDSAPPGPGESAEANDSPRGS